MAKQLGKEDPKAVLEEARDNLSEGDFLDAVRRMVAMNDKCAIQNSARQSLRKTLKSEGIVLGDLDAVIRMAEWDRTEQRAHFDNRTRYARWLGLAVGTQPDMFQSMNDRQVQEAEWKAVGRTAALTGKAASPPEECPPIFHDHFMSGFQEASDEEFESAAPPPEKKPAAKTKPKKPDAVAKDPGSAVKDAADRAVAAAAAKKAQRKAEAEPATAPAGKTETIQ